MLQKVTSFNEIYFCFVSHSGGQYHSSRKSFSAPSCWEWLMLRKTFAVRYNFKLQFCRFRPQIIAGWRKTHMCGARCLSGQLTSRIKLCRTVGNLDVGFILAQVSKSEPSALVIAHIKGFQLFTRALYVALCISFACSSSTCDCVVTKIRWSMRDCRQVNRTNYSCSKNSSWPNSKF